MAITPAAGRPAGHFRSALIQNARDTALISVVVFVAALVGSLSRPVAFLAAFWPANALLAGLMVRNPRFRAVLTLCGAFGGFMLAALAIGDDPWLGLLLTAANLAGVLTFVALFSALDSEDRSLSRPQGVISLLVVAAAAATSAGAVGAISSVYLQKIDYFDGWMAWFASELVNYLALVPVVLTVPTWKEWWASRKERVAQLRSGLLPTCALAVAVGLSLVVPNPVAIVLPVPTLIWCALTLPMSSTTILVMLYSGLAMMGIKLGLFDLGIHEALKGEEIASVHLGVALIALAPVVVASVTAERRRRKEQRLPDRSRIL